MRTVLDYGGREIAEGDLLLEARGKVYRVLQTDDGIRGQGLMRVVELRFRRNGWAPVGADTLSRAYHTYRVEERQLTGRPFEDRKLYDALHAELTAATVKAAIAERKKEVARWKNHVTNNRHV